MNGTSRIAILLVLASAATAKAGDKMKQEIDASKNVRLLDIQFARYPIPTRVVSRDGYGIRFVVPAGIKKMPQAGVYSFFAMAGDFEVTAGYQVFNLPGPKDGYGVSVGIAVDTEGPGGTVSLARGQLVGMNTGYIITRPKQNDKDTDFEHFSSSAKAGKLILRREKGEVICSVMEGPKDTLRELKRVKFTEAPIRKVRLFADTGGSPTALDARLWGVRIMAAEISGAIPYQEEGGGLWLWLAVVGLALAGGFYAYRRWQARTVYGRSDS